MSGVIVDSGKVKRLRKSKGFVGTIRGWFASSFDEIYRGLNGFFTDPLFSLYSDYKAYVGRAKEIMAVEATFGDNGTGLFKMAVKFRTSRIVSKNYSVEYAETATDIEKAWVTDLLAFNRLRKGFLYESGTLGEYQGHIVFTLEWNEDERKVSISALDYDLDYYVNGSGNLVVPKLDNATYTPENYLVVYLSDTHKITDSGKIISPPLMQAALHKLEAMDAILKEIRFLNNKYSKPTLFVKTDNEEELDSFLKWSKELDENNEVNLKLGQVFGIAGATANAKFIQIANAIQSHIEERKELAKELAGMLGIPLHKFGYPELVTGNLSDVADEMDDSALFDFNRVALEEGLHDLIVKSAALENANGANSINANNITGVNIPDMTPKLRVALQAVLAEDFENNRVSHRTYLENHYAIADADKELNRIQEEDETIANNVEGN